MELCAQILFQGWSTSIQDHLLTLFEVSCSEKAAGPAVVKAIKVNSDFTWTASYRGHPISHECQVLQGSPALVNTGKALLV